MKARTSTVQLKNPCPVATLTGRLDQPGRSSGLQPEGRGFKSPSVHHPLQRPEPRFDALRRHGSRESGTLRHVSSTLAARSRLPSPSWTLDGPSRMLIAAGLAVTLLIDGGAVDIRRTDALEVAS